MAVTRRRAIALLLLLRRLRRQKGIRRWWVHPLNQKRRQQGHFYNLVAELQMFGEKHHRYFRMSPDKMEYILSIVGEDLQGPGTNYRASIEPKQKLAVALRFLATGHDFASLAFNYRLGRLTVANSVHQTCRAIVRRMMTTQMPTPTEDTWLQMAKRFEERWNFPHCIGAIDGKHVHIHAPQNSGSMFFNYKKTFSIVLLALVDADYRFRYVQVGDYGKESDGGIYKNSPLGMGMQAGTMHVPADSPLPGFVDRPMPYVVVADAAFPLKPHVMKPYPEKHINHEKRIYNYRLSRARMVVECAFGILAVRWRVFHTKLNMKANNADQVILAACLLHNYLTHPREIRAFMREVEERGLALQQATNINVGNRNSREALDVRDDFCLYFNSAEGSVPWQERMVH